MARCLSVRSIEQAGLPESGTLAGEDNMFLVLFFVFLICWIFGWVVFHVAGGLIHGLLVVALIALIWHFVSRRSVA